MSKNEDLIACLRRALARRKESFFSQMKAEKTDCYRLFNGSLEGYGGMVLDRYGHLVLWQCFRERPEEALVKEVRELLQEQGWEHLVVVDRSQGAQKERLVFASEKLSADESFQIFEGGIGYEFSPWHKGRDPHLFLDFRPLRKRLAQSGPWSSILNLFCYTGSLGICAGQKGFEKLWQVDISERHLEIAQRNFSLGQDQGEVRYLCEDVYPVIWQLAGRAVKGRGSRRPYQKLAPECFELVILDPPRWAKGPFQAVDTLRDYSSLLRPCVELTQVGGTMVLANNHPKVDWQTFAQTIERSCEKSGRSIETMERVESGFDFCQEGENSLAKVFWVTLKS